MNLSAGPFGDQLRGVSPASPRLHLEATREICRLPPRNARSRTANGSPRKFRRRSRSSPIIRRAARPAASADDAPSAREYPPSPACWCSRPRSANHSSFARLINSHYVHIPRFSYEIQIKKKKNQTYNLGKKATSANVAQKI